MTAVNELVLPGAAAAAVVAEVARHGREGVETGGFLLAQRSSDTISVVALAGVAGIRRRRDLLQISEVALDTLFAHADEHGLWIPAQFHSHARAAFMSECDIEHGLCVDGLVTTIVPHFAAPPLDPSRWGWWRYEGAWTPVGAPAASSNTVAVVIFDEDGLRGA